MLSGDQIEQFESWELPTRGYQLWPYPVDLEPPYSPLLERLRPKSANLDDGRRPGLFQAWKPKAQPPAPQVFEEPQALPCGYDPPRLEAQFVLPEGFIVRAGLARELINSFHNLSSPLAFELLGVHEGIIVQLSYGERDRQVVQATIKAFFPEIKVRHRQNLLTSQWASASPFAAIIDFGLAEFVFRPISTDNHLETDPLIGIVGALNDLAFGEFGLLQILYRPAIAPWGRDLLHFATSVDEASSLVPLIEAKFGEPLFAATVRIAARSDTGQAAFDRARSIGNALMAATQSGYNSLFPLDNEDYPNEVHEQDILERTTHRTGMILSASELLPLVHLPSAIVRSERFIRQSLKTKAAPQSTHHGSIWIGINKHDDEERPVFLTREHRLRHTYIVGASGTGKSTLLLSMILQDISQGSGVCVLDPHGDLVEDVLARIPEHRIRDVILLDPSDTAFPVGFNILSAHSDLERTLLSSDLVGVFRRLSTSWGDQMTAVFGNAILAFLESTRGGTLLDLRRFLIEADFRKQFLDTVADAEVRYFWQKEFPLLKGLPQAPLLTRLDAFLRPKSIRYMVAQQKDHLDFRAIMDSGKILLAKLSQGAIGEENSYLLGSLLCARLSQAAASRQEQEHSARNPFFVYLDEFHNFITPSLAQLISGVRKYAVGLTLAHQDLRQVKSRSEDVASAVLSNACTRVVFRVSEHDARDLAQGLHFFEADDLQNLGLGQAIARVERARCDFNLETIRVPEPSETAATESRKRVVDNSRSRYATPLAEVEASLATTPPEPEPRAREVAANSSERVPEPPRQVNALVPEKPAPPARQVALPKQEVHLSGRGGPQHKYLQALLKRAGEDRGYHVILEKRVLDGAGHIDIALEREGVSIGCEVHITTPHVKELANLSKCLAAGFDYAVLVSSDKRLLARAQADMSEESSTEQNQKLRFLTPEAFLAFLEEMEAMRSENAKEVRGYKVKVKYRALSEEDKEARQKLIAEVVSKSLKRAKK